MRAPAPPSMRVPKGTIAHELEAVDHEWALRVAEAKARLEAEEREWQEQLERARRAIAAAEEAEWRALEQRAAEAARIAEEREWQERIARARSGAAAVATPLDPFLTAPPLAPAAQRPRPNVVYWP